MMVVMLNRCELKFGVVEKGLMGKQNFLLQALSEVYIFD